MAEPGSIDYLGARDDASWTGRVFIVQLTLDAVPSAGRYRGRVQHLRSSDAAHFESLEELALFMQEHTDESSDAQAPYEIGDQSS